MFNEVYIFLKNPDYQPDENNNIKYRFHIFLKLLGFSLVISLALGFVIGGLQSFTGIELGKHNTDRIFERYSITFIFFAAVVLAPLLEEFLFRGPMVFFKKSVYFKYIFYLLTLAFGFLHIINFEITPIIVLLSPLLVAPQLTVGVFLGFIRVRFGLNWAIALHAFYNLILVGPAILLKALNPPLE
jgi:membrane protease YdiL (CAAX protease family)